MTIQTMRDFGIGEGQLYIGGRWVDSASRDRREIANPTDESIVAAVPSATIEDADRAVAAARKAQPEWSRRTPMERGALLQKFATLIDENTETLAHLLTAEGGKLLPESRIDANFAALLLRYAAESARRLQGEILPGEGRDEQIWIQRVPYGVVAGITAWNFPAALFARKVGPALVTGNTIVVKPHELTPLTTLVLGELSRRAGIPEGVINIVVGDGRTVGAHLVSHKGTDLISMTGSVRAGGEIYALGAERIKPIRLELGGKAPFIVMDDADIDKAVDAAVTSKFFFGGSVCTCNDRMYLHKTIHDEFLDKFLAKVKKLKTGDPTGDVQVGPRISAVEVSKLEAMKAKAIEAEGDPAHRGQGARRRLRPRPLVFPDHLLGQVERPRNHEAGDLRPADRGDGGRRLRSGARLRQRFRLRPLRLFVYPRQSQDHARRERARIWRDLRQPPLRGEPARLPYRLPQERPRRRGRPAWHRGLHAQEEALRSYNAM